MIDPFAEVIALLQPRASYSKLVEAAGPWLVRRTEVGQVFYCMLLAGRACLAVDSKAPVELSAGDFVLIPETFDYTLSSLDPPPSEDLNTLPVMKESGVVRLGSPDGPAGDQMLVGYCRFGSPDADVLVSLLPDLLVVRSERRFGVLTQLVREEARADRPARGVVLEHLLQVLLIDALRAAPEACASTGLVCGLADRRLAAALRSIHTAPEYGWGVAELARKAGLSRSAFFTRFNRVVGMPPMGYVQTWRIALAKHYLRTGQGTVAQIATRVGYGSSSAFSAAFSRQVGCPPARFAREAIVQVTN